MDVLARKRALRALLRLKLQDMPESDIASQSLRIFHRLSKLACYQSAESVGLFISMKAEVRTLAQSVTPAVFSLRIHSASNLKTRSGHSL